MSDQLFTGKKRNYADLSLSSSRSANAIISVGDLLGQFFERLPCYLGKQSETSAGLKSFAMRAAPWLSDLATTFSLLIGALIRCVIGLIAGLLDVFAAPCKRTMFGMGSAVLSIFVLPSTLFISLIQCLLLLQSPLEKITKEEHQTTKLIFGDGRWLGDVRIIRIRYGLFGFISSSFVLGNLVILKSPARHILIHELVHVWQYRFLGARYAGNALLAQWKFGRNKRSGHAYDWKTIAAETGSRWLALNAEAAAQLIEDTYETVCSFPSNQQQSELIMDAYSTIRGK